MNMVTYISFQYFINQRFLTWKSFRVGTEWKDDDEKSKQGNYYSNPPGPYPSRVFGREVNTCNKDTWCRGCYHNKNVIIVSEFCISDHKMK